MAGRAIFRKSKSLAGAALVGLGIIILHANLSGTIAWIGHVFTFTQPVKILPAMILTALQVAPALGNQHILRILLQHALFSFWPLLLVVAGTFLSALSVADSSFSKRDCR